MNTNDFQEILLTEEYIETIVQGIADDIQKKHQGEEIILLGILKGSFIFLADLSRKLHSLCNVKINFIQISSYGENAESSGNPKIILDIDDSFIKGKKIIIVEDIIDTGITLKWLTDNLKSRGAKSVEVCVFLDKFQARKVDVYLNYIGKKVLNVFLVGYGLDYAEKYRNLPVVAILKEAVYKK